MKRLLANTTGFYAAQLCARAVNFGYVLLLARTLDTAAFGNLNLALSVLVIADTAADFGLSRLAVREIARDPSIAGRFLGHLVLLKLGLSAAAYGVALAFAAAAGYPPEVLAIMAIAGTGLVFTGAAMLLEMALHVGQLFTYVSIAHLVLSVVQVGAGALVLAGGGGVHAIAATYVVTNAVYCGMILNGLRRARIALPLSIDPPLWRTSLGQSFSYGVMALLAIVASRAEFLVLGWSAGDVDLGAYGIALKLMDAALLAPVTLSTVIAPVFANYHATSPQKLTGLYLAVLRIGLLVAIPGAYLAIAVVPPVLGLLLGGRYPSLVPVIGTMFAAFPFAATHCLNVGLLLGSDRQRRTVSLMGMLLVLQCLIAAVLITRGGTDGAAHAFFATSVVSAIASTLCVQRWFLSGAALSRALAPPFVASVAMLAVVVVPGASGAVSVAGALLAFAGLAAVLTWGLPLAPASEAPVA